ncbi:MAG: hypothetical protein M3N97_15490 [Pseudomonadota bacterium]|nr:hypothetical protein [Pseudomonadota bacterium]
MSWWELIDTVVGRVLVLLSCLAIATAASGGASGEAINPNGKTELTLKKSSGDIVRISITQMKTGASAPYKDALLWGGDVDELPTCVLSSMVVHERDESIFVPLSAYGDLGDVKLGSVDATTGGFVIILHGGGTATGYDATLMFSHGYLVSRTVRSREFPKESNEMTTYSFQKGN